MSGTHYESYRILLIIDRLAILIIGGTLSSIAVIAIGVIFIRKFRGHQSLLELKAAGLENFEEGNMEQIDPDLPLEDQADLLPYNKKFEFPKDKLQLGTQIGSGAYGVVMKGIAQKIAPNEEETTVAVKMAKRIFDNEVYQFALFQ